MKKWINVVCGLALAGLLLAACSPVSKSAETPTLAAPTPAQELPTQTAAPSPTPLPGKVLLAAPAGSDLQAVQPALLDLSTQAGLTLETRPALNPGDVNAEIKLVVLLGAPANLNEMAAAAPQTQFLVFSGADVPAAGNVSVVRQRFENQAFLTGFISVLLSTDYRAGGLLASDGPLGTRLKEAYITGGRYFCGTCAPGWPLNVYYPLVAELPATSDGAAWQGAAVEMFDNQKVEAYFVSPEALARLELVNYLQGKDQLGKPVLLVGTQPPPDALRAQWAATVRLDLLSPLKQLWPDLLAGKGGVALDAPLTVEDVNPQNLGEGRMRLVNELVQELAAGRVSPFPVPAE